MDLQADGRERDLGSHQLPAWIEPKGLPVLCATNQGLAQVGTCNTRLVISDDYVQNSLNQLFKHVAGTT